MQKNRPQKEHNLIKENKPLNSCWIVFAIEFFSILIVVNFETIAHSWICSCTGHACVLKSRWQQSSEKKIGQTNRFANAWDRYIRAQTLTHTTFGLTLNSEKLFVKLECVLPHPTQKHAKRSSRVHGVASVKHGRAKDATIDTLTFCWWRKVQTGRQIVVTHLQYVRQFQWISGLDGQNGPEVSSLSRPVENRRQHTNFIVCALDTVFAPSTITRQIWFWLFQPRNMLLLGVVLLVFHAVFSTLEDTDAPRAYDMMWNAPTVRCAPRHSVTVDPTPYGIRQNRNNGIIGRDITLLYIEHTGLYPYFTPHGRAVHGGLPQASGETTRVLYEQEIRDYMQIARF